MECRALPPPPWLTRMSRLSRRVTVITHEYLGQPLVGLRAPEPQEGLENRRSHGRVVQGLASTAGRRAVRRQPPIRSVKQHNKLLGRGHREKHDVLCYHGRGKRRGCTTGFPPSCHRARTSTVQASFSPVSRTPALSIHIAKERKTFHRL